MQLELTLAGMASRGTSELADLIIKIALGLLALLLLFAGSFGAALLYVIWFLLWFGYDILFETRYDGRSPGNKMSGIRVVSEDGGTVTFQQSAIRTLLRIVDSLPGFYLVGAIAMAASAKNQRLGDRAAGTLVIRERFGDDADLSVVLGRKKKPATEPVRSTAPAPAWNVAAVTTQEMVTVRQFIERRGALRPESRARLATQIAAHLRTKVVGIPPGTPDEALIEGVAAAKAARG